MQKCQTESLPVFPVMVVNKSLFRGRHLVLLLCNLLAQATGPAPRGGILQVKETLARTHLLPLLVLGIFIFIVCQESYVLSQLFRSSMWESNNYQLEGLRKNLFLICSLEEVSTRTHSRPLSLWISLMAGSLQYLERPNRLLKWSRILDEDMLRSSEV